MGHSNTQREPAEVFISYASADRARVMAVTQALQMAGVSVWRDGEQMRGGEAYNEKIVHAIRRSKVFVLMCSPSAFASDNVHQEVMVTWESAQHRILPVWLTAPGAIPDRFQYCLAGRHHVLVSNRATRDWLNDLLAALRGFGVKDSSAQAGHDSTPSPQPKPASGSPAKIELAAIDSRAAARQLQQAWLERLNQDASWTNDAGVAFRLVPPGRFRFGAAPGDARAHADEKPAQVTAIERPLWVAAFPLTNGTVRQFLESASAADGAPIGDLVKDRGFADRCRRGAAADGMPAVEVNAQDALTLCQWMGLRDGRCYRLPTEAEWEYLARAGAMGPYLWDGDAGASAIHGGAGPAAEDPRRANEWGICDPLGNVAEWTFSEYGPTDSGAPFKLAHRGTAATLTVRGGSWRDPWQDLRLSRRVSMNASSRKDWLGVRVVCEIDAI